LARFGRPVIVNGATGHLHKNHLNTCSLNRIT